MNFKIKKIVCFSMILAATALPADSPKVYKELRTPKPANHRTYSIEEFQIDHDRLAARPNGLVYGNRAGLLKLARFYETDELGKKLWKTRRKFAVNILNNWYFKQSGFERHIYWCFQMESLGYIYTLTGHKALGQFLHDHIMQIARLPEDFWLHRELRRYRPERPLGMIETGQLAWKLSCVMSGTEDLFSPEELAEVKRALRTKGLIPLLNYLEDTKAVNNFLAIVAIGAYVSGKYLEVPEACAAGKNALLRFINHSVESDGSYGEGSGYFTYPMNSLLPAVAAMPPEERKQFFEQSGLRHSPEWLAYPYLYSTMKNSRDLRVVYGDNSYQERPAQFLLAMLSDIRHDPLATWMGRYFTGLGDSWQCSDWRWALIHLAEATKTPEKSPAQRNLPLIRGFENGENFIRSSWETDSTVLSLYTAGPTRVRYAHQRPERNSINLGAYGEYLIVSPHSASYRSPIHYNYDLSTLSANTIRIDGRDQLFPIRGGGWGDLPSCAVYGHPEGRLARLESGPGFDVLAGDARLCYQEKPETALRTILYRRKHNYFVVVDRMSVRQGAHTYTALWHFNNRDGKLSGDDGTGDTILLKRPRADLAVSTFADCNLTRTWSDGYMHGIRRDYSPGGRNEGKPGSARVLNVSNTEKAPAVTLLTVLQPLRKGVAPRPVSYNDNRLVVGDDTFLLNNGTIECGGQKVPCFH